MTEGGIMVRSRGLVAVGFVAVLAAAGTAAGVTSASAAGQLTAAFSKDSDWGTGYQGRYTITNGTAAAITSWRVELDLPSGSTLASYWDVLVSPSGSHYVATNRSYNGTVAAGASTVFGFIVTGSGTPANCTINGASCAGGGTPSASPSPSPSPSASASPSRSTSPSPTPSSSPTTAPPPGGKKVVGYFVDWGVYARNYHVKNVYTSGSAAKLSHLLYAFGNVQNGQCTVGDSYADYDRFYTAAESVDGVADTWDAGALRGSFGQLRRLKRMFPNLKVIWSFGGWTWSPGFSQAAANPAAFANSCYNLVEDPRWGDVFDGIDIDWEYPGACGISCDSSPRSAFPNLMSALRSRFGSGNLVTAAVTADGSAGGKIETADYAGAGQYVNWYMPMTYDYFGAWDTDGPTAPHSPLTSYSGIPIAGFYADAALQKLKGLGIPASKLLLGVGFYGRGWTGVSQSAPGGSASGAAPGTYEQGVDDYKVLKGRCPATGTVAGTAYAFCGGQWWSYDTPGTIAGKMSYANNQGLGGAFFWELSGDTSNGELVTAVRNGIG
jgi:chitinase